MINVAFPASNVSPPPPPPLLPPHLSHLSLIRDTPHSFHCYLLLLITPSLMGRLSLLLTGFSVTDVFRLGPVYFSFLAMVRNEMYREIQR